MTVRGLEELQRKLGNLAKNVTALNGEHEIPVTELLTPEFLLRNTRFTSLEGLLERGGLTGGFEAVSKEGRDTFIRANSSFTGWDDMIRAAAEIWVKKKLGL